MFTNEDSLQKIQEQNQLKISRRTLLQRTAVSVAGIAGLAALTGEASANVLDTLDYAPFRMGIQSYSLRGYKIEEALKKTQALGLTYLEAYPDHLPISDDPKVLKNYHMMLKDHRVKLTAYGVVYFGKEEKAARQVFDFARAMGITTLSADPDPEAFPILDKLVAEYRINIAIHNHGPGSRYDKVSVVQNAVKNYNVRIGACDDTGHYLHSGEDPVAAVLAFGPRLHDVHLKNARPSVNGGEPEFTEVGVPGGLLDTVALMRALLKVRYKGPIMLEYEEHAEDPIPGITMCLTATRAAAAVVRQSANA